MTKPDLQAKYEELYGEKPKHTVSKAELEQLINAKESQDNIEEIPESEAGAESDRDVVEEQKQESKITDEQIEAEIKSASRTRDGKRHLVFKDGKEVWWRPSVIEIMYKSLGPERITFPKNTEYILQNPKKCTTCG